MNTTYPIDPDDKEDLPFDDEHYWELIQDEVDARYLMDREECEQS